MSYDIELKDPVTKEVIELPIKHLMTGGTFAADYDEKTGRFTPKPVSEAHLNITYNYADYYYDAVEGDNRFFGKRPDDYEDEEPRELGIRGIYGKTGAESIPMLKDLIQRIESKYKKNGEWITTTREVVKYFDSLGNELDDVELLSNSYLDKGNGKYHKKECTKEVSEAPNRDYWEATAGNAIRPLYQLIAMAELRPDGVWDGD